MAITKSSLISLLRNYCVFGFPVSQKTWDWLGRPLVIDAQSGSASEIFLLRKLADQINGKRIHSAQPLDPLHAGQLATVGVLVDIFRYIIEIYSHEEQPGVIPRGLDRTATEFGKATISQPPPKFVRFFPPVSVLTGKETEADYLRSTLSAPSAQDTIVREMILLHLSTSNPAFRPIRPLFDDEDVKRESPYVQLIKGLEQFFATQPPFGPVGLTLFECLYAPIKAAPDSLEGQLYYIRQHWAHFLPLDLLERLLLALDILTEEHRLRGDNLGASPILQFGRGAFGYDLGYAEPAAFSRDADWMSNVVLIAKTIYVWLFQLSKKYNRDIRLLSDIPDEELDRLARWGFTGLWLIGLWERSSASQKIKQIMGNPEAASSAYSLYDYVIAADLGGEEAYQELKRRAWQRGIRLASDMVPNHMGIYSKWVIEHPQWFIQSDYPPFPVYQFTGVDLSEDPRVCVQIEDGYWQHRDAAVVFKRIDKWTGDVRYIYHGNDGTSMPWNDTAQLNFLMPEVREAVIQTILHVARKFPIIRFDAAMTLAKRHYQRLWFPQPGDGGAIPSRAEHAITKGEFDAQVPKEFWREVVDRVTQEVPETLLLAEAFWLMEGYFVRTLGMHRVYNSAFMNMLKMEENSKYRMTIKNVLEFSPEVIKRFVNFMNNPDERTAVDQFGREDKYFGVAMMMVTMPGLPMFGHGQIEGFVEKYGMEYRRSYWDEQVDEGMVQRHEAQIFPLMRRRHLFSGAANFAFYDFVSPEGWVDENVFAYSNRVGDERALILYNNAFNTTRGKVHLSTSINVGDADQASLVRRTLGEALALNTEANCFYAFRDYRTGQEYLRSGCDLAEKGLFAELYGYQYHAFLDFREIHDSDGSWRELERRMAGGGVASVDESHQELLLEPVLSPFRQLVNADRLRSLKAAEKAFADSTETDAKGFLQAAKTKSAVAVSIAAVLKRFRTRLDVLVAAMPHPAAGKTDTEKMIYGGGSVNSVCADLGHVAYAWLAVVGLDQLLPAEEIDKSVSPAVQHLDDWLLEKGIGQAFEGYLSNSDQAYWDSRLIRILLSHLDLLDRAGLGSIKESFRRVLLDPMVREYLQVHSYEDSLWLNKERLERMVYALALAVWLSLERKRGSGVELWGDLDRTAQKILDAAGRAGYRVDKAVELLA